jgi:hypothetical protein
MAPTLTPPIPRVHPSIKHQPNHGIRSHFPTPILTDPTMVTCSFHHEIMDTISLDLMLSHVEGVDLSAAYLCNPWGGGVGGGAMLNHIHHDSIRICAASASSPFAGFLLEL